MQFGKPLTDVDLRDLEKRYITRHWAEAAQFRIVDHLEGKEMFHGRPSGGDYAGMLLPYFFPGNDSPVTYRLRRRNPEIDARTNKPRNKYLSYPGDRPRLYIPPHTTMEMLQDATLPLLIVEGEFKAVALRRLAGELAGYGIARFVVVAVNGIWSWRGTIGKTMNENGERVPQKGVLPDFDLINFVNRDTIIAFDMDQGPRTQVRTARHQLSIELRTRGANVGYLEWDPDQGKGPDDLLANMGQDFVHSLIAKVEFNTTTGWESKLLCTTTGTPKAILENVRIALSNEPEFIGLSLDEFADRVYRPPTLPWPSTKEAEWTDADSSELAAWLQRKRIDVNSALAYEGVRLVAARNSFHPVRNYLNSLQWDSIPRLDTWLVRYAGAKASNYVSAVGRCWLISAVARIFNPGPHCKADSALLLIGPEGRGKSTLCRILADPWFSDNLPDLSDQKESANHLIGNWIVELSELAAVNKAALNLTKAFLSRAEDVYRPYYGRATVRRPRQCVFIATSNGYEPLRDPSGNRRFWPVTIGTMDTAQLAIDRDQLWAEAVAMYREGVSWYLSDESIMLEATHEQAQRTEQHVWHDAVVNWVTFKEYVTIADVLSGAIRKELAHQTQQDKNAVASILQSLGWRLAQRRIDGKRPKVYLNPEWLEGSEPEDDDN